MANDWDNDVRLRQPRWLKSSYSSGSGMCVEVRFELPDVLIRDSKFRRSPTADLSIEPIITVPVDAWLRFLDQFSGSAFSYHADELVVEMAPDGAVVFRSGIDGVELSFTRGEIVAFTDGVKAGEFRPELATA